MAELTAKKLSGAMYGVAALSIAGTVAPTWMLSPEPYAMGQAVVAQTLGVPRGAVKLKAFGAAGISVTGPTGEASFVLCGPASACFTVTAVKSEDTWEVVELEPL